VTARRNKHNHEEFIERMTTKRQRILAVLCYVEHEGLVLMLHRHKEPNLGQWTAPGGKMEWDESPLECVVREMREETGLKVEQPELRGIITEVSPTEHYQWLMFVYVARQFSGRVGSCKEGTLAWVPIEKVLELPVPQADAIFFPKIMSNGPVYQAKFTYDEQLRLVKWEEAIN